MPDWLTEKQAQAYLGVSRATLYRWQRAGRLTVYKVGRQRRYKRADLDGLAVPIVREVPDEEAEDR